MFYEEENNQEKTIISDPGYRASNTLHNFEENKQRNYALFIFHNSGDTALLLHYG